MAPRSWWLDVREAVLTASVRQCFDREHTFQNSQEIQLLALHKVGYFGADKYEGRWDNESGANLQLRSRCRMVCLRRAVAPAPFCCAMLCRLLNTPLTVSGAGCISIVCAHHNPHNRMLAQITQAPPKHFQALVSTVLQERLQYIAYAIRCNARYICMEAAMAPGCGGRPQLRPQGRRAHCTAHEASAWRRLWPRGWLSR